MARVTSQLSCAIELQRSTTLVASGHGRSRFTAQNVKRASSCAFAKAVSVCMSATVTMAFSSLRPFMDEMPNYQHFDEALPPERKRRIMKFYKSMLQRHMYATGKKYFVAKNPAFSPKIATLLEFFPDARIIYLARNPLDMLPSTVSWINYARRAFTDPKEKYLYLEEIVDLTQHWYRYPLQYLDSHPSPRHLILNYDDLIQRPEQVIRSFYEQFGYPDKPGLDRIVDEAVKETLSFRSDHIYSYEEMGFTHRQILEMYADIFDRFGFDKREDEITEVDQPVVVSAVD